MKTLLSRRPLILLLVVFILGVVVPAQAVRFSKNVVWGTAVFQTASTTRIAVGVNPSAALPNLNIGDRVNIAYDQENGALVAHHISDGVPAKPLNSSVKRAVQHTSIPSTFAHVHGIVQSVDVQAGTLTIAYRVR